MPPLRSHPDDIPLLVEYFIDSFNTEFRKRVLGATPAAYALLQSYGWPGNVRELRNVIERAMLLSDSDRLDARDFTVMTSAVSAGDEFELPATGVDLESSNEAWWCRRCDAAAGNQTRAGTFLGLNRDQIRYRIEKFGLTADTLDFPDVRTRGCHDERCGHHRCGRARRVHRLRCDGPRNATSSRCCSFLVLCPSPSLYYRFLGLPSLTAARVRALVAADGRAGTSLVAEAGGRIVAFAGFYRDPASDRRAEVAFAVVRCPAGPRHRHASARAPRRASPATQGIDTFDAYVLATTAACSTCFAIPVSP